MIEFLERLREINNYRPVTQRDRDIKALAEDIYYTISGSIIFAYRWEIGDVHGYADQKKDIPAEADAVTPLYRHPPKLDAERVLLIKKITHLLNLGGYLYDGEEILFGEILSYLRGESNDKS